MHASSEQADMAILGERHRAPTLRPSGAAPWQERKPFPLSQKFITKNFFIAKYTPPPHHHFSYLLERYRIEKFSFPAVTKTDC